MPKAVRILRSGWIPAAVVLLASLVLLSRSGVPAGDLTRYALWMLLGIAVPGTLIWRALRGRPRTFAEDAAAGVALGTVLQIFASTLLRAADRPTWILWWPVLVIGVFALVPRLQRHWRSRGADRAPPGWSWSVALLLLAIIGWMAFAFLRTHPLTGPVAEYPYVDFPYHLALAGEVKHHMPPTWPYIAGEPLHHHWFGAASTAATSWATGVEIRTIMLRLDLFPYLAVAVTLTATLASRIARRWWPGPAAIAIGWFVSALTPYYWMTANLLGDQRLLADFHWQSPSSLLGAAVFAPIPILMTARFRRERGAAGQWALIVLLLAGSMGTKSTLVPLFLAGAGLAGLMHLLGRRRIQTAALLGLIAGGAALAVSTFALYGGDTYGVTWSPLEYVRRLPVVTQVGFAPREVTTLATRPVLGLTALMLVAWLARMAGAAGLISRRDRERDPSTAFLLGIVVAGVAIALLFTHPGTSQIYFLRSAFPFVGVLSAAGIASVVPPRRPSGPIVAALAAAALTGAGLLWIAGLGRVTPPVAGDGVTRADVLIELAKPMLAFAAAIGAGAVALGIARARIAWLRGVTAALILAAIAGAGLTPTIREGATIAATLRRVGARAEQIPTLARPIPLDGLTAARWLRDHSNPSDVIATNVHCRYVTKVGCENRHFWISGYAERRVLVEGWGYTTDAMSYGPHFSYAPFDDEARLARNDLAFAEPTAARLAALRDTDGVRWLFVDGRYTIPPPTLATLATLRFRAGAFSVYEIGASG